jgi:hypothetical protein
MEQVKPGWRSSEFARGVFLYLLAAYAISKGYGPDEIRGTIGAVADQAIKYKELLVTMVAVIAPMVDNIHYTKKRTEIKKEALSAGRGNRE